MPGLLVHQRHVDQFAEIRMEAPGYFRLLRSRQTKADEKVTQVPQVADQELPVEKGFAVPGVKHVQVPQSQVVQEHVPLVKRVEAQLPLHLFKPLLLLLLVLLLLMLMLLLLLVAAQDAASAAAAVADVSMDLFLYPGGAEIIGSVRKPLCRRS